MATEAASQVLDTSVDTAGLSVVSAMMTAENPRHGSMYNPVVLAAGVPVWFHPLNDGRFIAVFRSHWIAATVGADGPQSYTGHTEAGSCWVRVAPPGGGTVALGKIPTRHPGDPVINAAVSRIDYLFTLGNLDGDGLLQYHRVSAQGTLVLQAEELLFPINGVVFDRGCYLSGEHLMVFGADGDDLFLARRRWGRIGQPDPTPGYTWEYRSARGWLADPDTLEPFGLTSAGPVSVAAFKDRLLVSTVARDDTDVYTATVFQSRATDPWGRWKPLTPTLPLGDVDSYLGGALYFQPQLSSNPSFSLPLGAATQIPFVTSVLDAGSGQAINTAWGLWSVLRTV